MMAPLRRGRPARPGLNVVVGLFTVVLIAALWTVVVLQQDGERDDAIATAITQNSNLAVAYEEHIERTLKGLDGALLFMRHEYRRLGPQLDMNRYVAEGIIDGSLFSILSVVDEHGDLVVSTLPGDKVNYADRAFFKVHREQAGQDRLYINVPVLGRVSNTWQVPMSRRIIKPDGSFGGVIVLSVDPAYFARFYQKTDIGRYGLVMLVGLDGVVRARRVGEKLSFGLDISDGALMKRRARSAVGTFFSDGGGDSIQRQVSYRTLPGYPLMVAVGTAQVEILADFERNRQSDFGLAFLVSVVIAFLAGMLMLTIRRQQRASVALAISEARFRAAFEQAAIGIVHTSLDRHYLQVNQKFCDMMGYTREELVGRSSDSVTYPEDRETGGGYRDQLLSGRVTNHTAEKRYVRKDGSLVWVNRTVSLVRDDAGEPLYFLRVVEDITARKRLEAELRELATTDMLTGLPNRRAFITRLDDTHARLRRFESEQAAVLMLDLDYFKRINDTHGHPAGDAVLRQVAAVINGQIREIDLCSRLGGEEFAVLLAGAAPAAAREFAERLRSKITELVIEHDGRPIRATASIGVAALRADDDNADAALLRADRALYQAKNSGRNRVEVNDDAATA